MNDTARRILADFKKQEVLEASAFDHSEEEHAERFHTYGFDVATTEREYLEFLYALLVLEQPRRVLESGTGSGVSTLILLAAMQEVHFRLNAMHHEREETPVPYRFELCSVDTRYTKGVKLLAERYSLDRVLRLEQGKPTLHFLHQEYRVCEEGNRARDGWMPFNVAIFDSEQSVKAHEAEFALFHRLIAPDGLLIFHDTAAAHHLNRDSDYLQHLHKLRQQFNLTRLDFPWSRGLTVMRYFQPKEDVLPD